MIDVELPTTDNLGWSLLVPLYGSQEKDQLLLLNQLKLQLPAQPPPKITDLNNRQVA